MVVSNFRVGERADTFEFRVGVLKHNVVPIFPDTSSECMECCNCTRNSVLPAVSLYEARFGRMNGGRTGPRRSEKTFHGLMPSNLFLLFQCLNENGLKVYQSCMYVESGRFDRIFDPLVDTTVKIVKCWMCV
jgi:hypothetical protein